MNPKFKMIKICTKPIEVQNMYFIHISAVMYKIYFKLMNSNMNPKFKMISTSSCYVQEVAVMYKIYFKLMNSNMNPKFKMIKLMNSNMNPAEELGSSKIFLTNLRCRPFLISDGTKICF